MFSSEVEWVFDCVMTIDTITLKAFLDFVQMGRLRSKLRCLLSDLHSRTILKP